jgi:hypothetical protein
MSENISAPGPCVSCGADLAVTPYVRDKKGKGLCKPCVAKIKAKRDAKAAAQTAAQGGAIPLASSVDEPDLMNALLADSPQMTKGICEGCKSFIDHEAVICTHCGYNRQTGKSVVTRVIAAPKEKEGSGAGLAAATAVADSMWWIPSLIFGLIGAGIGAGVWYFVGTAVNAEVGYVAALVGFLAGAGCMYGSRGNAGVLTGGLAAILAIGGIGLAKWGFVEDGYREAAKVQVDHRYAIDVLASIIQEEAGRRTVAVPTISRRGRIGGAGAQYNRMSMAEAERKAEDHWYNVMDDSDRREMLDDLRSWQNEIQRNSSELKQEIFTGSLGMFDIIFAIVAIGVALGVGSGGQISFGGDD